MKSTEKVERTSAAPAREQAAVRRAVATSAPQSLPVPLPGPQAAGNQAVQRLLREGVLQPKLLVSPPGDPLEQEADHIADHLVSSAPPHRVQRTCAACATGTAPCPACAGEEPTIQPKARPGTVPNLSPRAAARIGGLGGGQPLPAPVRGFFEGRFGRDLGGVRVHTDAEAGEAAQSIQARAFTRGSDVVFGAGEYAPQSRAGQRLLAHELVHVVQQGQAAREEVVHRQPADAPAPVPSGSSAPASDPPPSGHPEGLIVEDSASDIEPEQMKRSAFMSQLRSAAYGAAEQALASSSWAPVARPQVRQRLDEWFGANSGLDGRALENAIRQQVPGASGVRSAAAFIPLIADQVRQTVMAKLPKEEAVTGMVGAFMGVVGGAAQVVGSVISSIGSLFFKAREGGARKVDDPTVLPTRLRRGRALDSRLAGMGTAFGHNFSSVRVHTDAEAAHLADSMNARAFTFGQDIAFGTGEYQPGTVIGDALIAHELAHVAQQGRSHASMMSSTQDSASDHAFEADANRAAIGAVASLWGMAQGGLSQIARNAVPALRSGLRLQRCDKDWDKPTPQVTPASPSATPTAPAPSAQPNPEEPLRDELTRTGRTRQAAIDDAVGQLGIDVSLLQGGRMFFNAFLGTYGKTTTPFGYKRTKDDEAIAQRLNLGKNEKPHVVIGEACFAAKGWSTLFTTIVHEYQHVKQVFRKSEMIAPLPKGALIGPAQEVEAHAQDILQAEKLAKDNKPVDKEGVQDSLDQLKKNWNSIQDNAMRAKLKPLYEQAKATAERLLNK